MDRNGAEAAFGYPLQPTRARRGAPHENQFTDYDDVTEYGLDDDLLEEILRKQTECTFIWGPEGPLGGRRADDLHLEGRSASG